MTAFTNISAALDKHTATLGFPVAWENKEYQPEQGQLYLQVNLLPADVKVAWLEHSALDENLGIYQLDVYAPMGGGKSESMTACDAIADSFAGATVSYNGLDVIIKDISRGSGRREGAYYIVPIFISYRCYSPSR